MSRPKLSEERMLKLRLAARALIEWKEPPTSPRYKQVVKELLAVHPFAAQAGFSPDSPAFKLDTQGITLWYLSETLDDANAGRFLAQPEPDEESKIHGLAAFRRKQFDKLLSELSDSHDQKLGYGLSVISLLYFIFKTIQRSTIGGEEQLHVNRFLVSMLGESKEAKLGLLKGLAVSVGNVATWRKGGWGFWLFRAATKTPPAFALTLILLWAIVVTVAKFLWLPRWAEVAMATFFFLLLADSLTTKKIYYLLKNSSLEFRLLKLGFRKDDNRLVWEDGLRIYTGHLGIRCLLDEGFLPSFLKEHGGEEFEALWWLLPYYPGEGVESMLGLLTDTEISAHGRARIFAWLCRVRIAPRDDLFAQPIRSYLELYWASMGAQAADPGAPTEDGN